MSMPLIRHLPGLMAVGLMLSGCVSFGSKPPPQLLTISSEHQISTGQNIRKEGLPGLAIMIPEVPRKLATTRVPVQVDPTSVAYVKDAQWTEAPRDLFQRLLSETITADGAAFVVDEDQYALNPDRRLTGGLLDFGIDAQTREAVVTYDAVLTSSESPAVIRRRFTARVPVSDIKANKVAAPINLAANKVAEEVTAWVRAN